MLRDLREARNAADDSGCVGLDLDTLLRFWTLRDGKHGELELLGRGLDGTVVSRERYLTDVLQLGALPIKAIDLVADRLGAGANDGQLAAWAPGARPHLPPYRGGFGSQPTRDSVVVGERFSMSARRPTRIPPPAHRCPPPGWDGALEEIERPEGAKQWQARVSASGHAVEDETDVGVGIALAAREAGQVALPIAQPVVDRKVEGPGPRAGE